MEEEPRKKEKSGHWMRGGVGKTERLASLQTWPIQSSDRNIRRIPVRGNWGQTSISSRFS